MPGLNQLKQFSTDILTLGDEQAIRATRGEIPSTLPIPTDVEDRDDSDDFALGMPSVSEEELAQAEAAAAEQEKSANDFTDITGEEDDENAPQQQNTQSSAQKAPNVSDLLAPAGDADLGDLDLSEFEEPEAPKEPPKPKEVPIEDLDLDALLAPKEKPQAPKAKTQPTAAKPAAVQSAPSKPTVAKQQPKSAAQKKEEESFEAEFPPELQAVFNNKPNAAPKKSAPVEEVEDLEPLDEEEPKSAPVSNDDFAFEGNAINLNEGLPSELDETPDAGESAPAATENAEPKEEPESADSFEMPEEPVVEKTTAEAPSSEADQSFEMPDFGDTSFETPSDVAGESPAAPTENSSFEEPSFDSFAGAETSTDNSAEGSTPEKETVPEEENAFDEKSASETQSSPMDEFDTSALDNLPDFGASPTAPPEPSTEQAAEESVPQEEPPAEKFDTSAMEGMDFSGSNDEPAPESTSPDETGGTDFELAGSDSFNIPGFSDTTTADLHKTQQPLSTPDFSSAKTNGAKPKNTFTDAEYKRFEKNLSEYPLNVRVALEDLVVKNEFTDDAVFAILEKVLRRVPAKQLASDLEKMLDITLDVPRDYERRTAEEYDAYKKSVEYQLKNRLIPGAILSAGAAVLVFCIFTLVKTFIYVPLMANSLYRYGYTLLERNEYPQSEMEFDKALTFKPIKKWFFRYAEGYRKHMQYERATMMYRAVLQRFDHDKQAGLDWADMELYDLFNYEEAERILKREVLDYHISDPDAMLLLGDTYLEWGTEKDPSKFEPALEQYAQLLQLYGAKNQDLYLGRMMRYYIRTDNLNQVLQYKAHFYPLKKALGAQDLTELSGYLLDKRYGQLKPSEENLRFSIENVRELLERAVKADPNNPIALYNFGRYFVETANNPAAKKLFKSALEAFAQQQIRNKRDTYKYINTYRLMGEQNRNDKEYIPAEQMYVKGIALYEKENESSGFESDENIGKLYADLGDLNYFISGNMDTALDNYTKSINNKNDTPSVRYRVGYIQYNKQNYTEALGSFISCSDRKGDDTHMLLALANTLSVRNDNYAAQGYYEKLLAILDKERQLHNVMLPQVREDQADIVDTYMKAANNLGVTLNRLALETGDSKMNAEAIVRLSESLRAWDALTRNQTSMVRLDGSNLPQQNIKYIDHPMSTYTPEIFTEIPRMLNGEKGIE